MSERAGATWRRRDPWWGALALVLLASTLAAWHWGTTTPAGFGADEAAHTAYAEVLAEGRLPDVSTPIPAADDDARAGRLLGPQSYVYVANHPPLFAGVQAGLAAVLNRVGVDDAPARTAGRVLNAACFLAAVAMTAVVGRSLTGSLRHGVLAAGLFAATPALWSLATYGYSDGGGVLATMVVVHAGVAAWRGIDDRSMLLLGAAVALAASMRASALVVALLVAVAVAARAAVADPPDHRAAGRTRGARALRATALTTGPAAVLAGWWYLRTWRRFGDPVASTELIDRLGRDAPQGGAVGRFQDLEVWWSMAGHLVTSSHTVRVDARPPMLGAAAGVTIATVAAVGLLGLVVARWWPREGRSLPGGWTVWGVAIGGAVVATALHLGNGGSPHPRYLLPAIPLLAIGVVTGLDRLHRWAAPAAFVGAIAVSAVVARRATDWIATL